MALAGSHYRLLHPRAVVWRPFDGRRLFFSPFKRGASVFLRVTSALGASVFVAVSALEQKVAGMLLAGKWMGEPLEKVLL